jgi:hypothetical protein
MLRVSERGLHISHLTTHPKCGQPFTEFDRVLREMGDAVSTCRGAFLLLIEHVACVCVTWGLSPTIQTMVCRYSWHWHVLDKVDSSGIV